MTIAQIQYWLEQIALIGVALCFAVMGGALIAAWLYGVVRRAFGVSWVRRVVLGVFVAGLVQYAATKSNISYDGGIKGGANPSYVTNDTIHIEWQRDTRGGVWVPEWAAVYIDYRPNTETNADWGLLAQTTVGAWSWDGTLADATNYDYNVWAYYIPPEPVHTNGVWYYKTMKDRAQKYAIPIRARIRVNNRVIATPKGAREND